MGQYRVTLNDRLSRLVDEEHVQSGLETSEIITKALNARYRPTAKRRTVKPLAVELPEIEVRLSDIFTVAYSHTRERWLLYVVRRENGSDVPAVIHEYLTKTEATEAARQLRFQETTMQDALWQLRKEKIV